MAAWLTQRRLSQNVARLKRLRVELAQIDEQLDVFSADADDTAIRALVSETPGASQEANEARKHAEAMARHRRRVLDDIRELERRQDELLDQLSASRPS
jgi:DNA-binding transcriptional MerR regulator